ncbi:MAG: YraN family protein [Gemmatimonadales bacterium]|nr:YraN family protein [Gemmatimonadales bacterium]
MALQFLVKCGYRCMAKRFRRPGGEIDLVLRRGDILVFVEVKIRGPGSLAPAEYWVHPRQLQRMRRLARVWLSEGGGCPPGGCRFDVVAIDFAGEDEGLSLRHHVGVG